MRTVTFVVVALFSVTGVFSLPRHTTEVPPNCVDPTFACQDLESARLCKVVKSCIHDIWSTMSAPDDNDDICQICKEMVKEARDQLLSNMTQEEIKEVFEGSCKLLPIKLVADACIKAVDEFIPELVEMLASRMDPTMVCTVSGLCNLAHLPIHGMYKSLLHLITSGRPFVSNCDDCTRKVANAKRMFSEITKEEFARFINTIIPVVQRVPDGKLILHYLGPIYRFLASTMEPKSICSASGVCPMTCGVRNKPRDDLTCQFCTNVLQHIKDMATANSTVEEFRTALHNFCNHTGSFSSRCTSLVDNYFDTLFGFIRNMDTKEVCTLIGLCNNDFCANTPLIKVVPAIAAHKRIIQSSKLMPSLPVNSGTEDTHVRPVINIFPPMIPSKKADNNKESDMSNEIFGSSSKQLPLQRFSHPLLTYDQNLECNFCKAITYYLESDLKGETGKEHVEDALNKVCDKWVPEYPEYCRIFLSKYSLRMKQNIVRNGDFINGCYNIKACSQEERPDFDVKVIKQDNTLCDLCKTTCDEIESQLKNPSVKKSVETALYQICSYLPQSLSSQCHTMINDNIDNIFNILEQELDGDNLCPAIHLCPGDMRKNVSPFVKDIECDLCKDFVTQLQQKLQDPTVKKSFENLLDSACSMLPQEIASECRDFVNQNIDNLVNIIVQDLDPTLVCSALSICPGSIHVKPKKVGDLECDLCKEVITEVVAELKDGATEDEIKQVLDKVCSYFPSSMAAKCENFVNQYSALIITILTEELDPALVCAALKLCPGSVYVKPQKVTDVECDLCKEVIAKVVAQLKDGATEDEIKQVLDKACSYLPSSMAAKCENFVNQYSALLITILTEELDPSLVCAALKLCPGSVYVKPQKVTDVECDLCKEVIAKVVAELKDGATEDEIKQVLDKVCSYLPSSMAAKCENFVNQYSALLITILTEELDPAMVCAALKICPAKKELLQRWKYKAQDIECEGCQYVFHYIQEQLMNSKSQDALKEAFKRVCKLLPGVYAENCDAFIDEFGSSLLVIIAQEMDPTIACKTLGVCTSVKKPLKQKPDIVDVKALALDKCDLCTTVVNYLDQLLEEDDVDKEITTLAEKVCTVIPSFTDQCTTFFETYGPYLLQMIGQLADSKQVCQEIDMCPRTPGHVHLLGGEKCTFGPSYWCQSKFHASACKADTYCREKVWNK